MEFQLDHCNIDSLRHLFSNYSRKSLETMKSLTLAEQDIPRFPGYSTWSIFRSLEDVDLHGCGLETVPGSVLVQALPGLKKLNLAKNRLTTVDDLLSLGKLNHFLELNLRNNPIPYVSHRITLIQTLLFPLSEIRFKFSKYLLGEYRQSGIRPLRDMRDRRTKSYTGIRQFLKLIRKPAKVPRSGRFPMLTVLNEQVITEDEVASAKPYKDEEVIAPSAYSRTANSTPIQLRRMQMTALTRKTHYNCCLVRKPKIDPVPRFIKIPEYFGEAALRSEAGLRVRIKQVKERRERRRPERNDEDSDVSKPPSVAAEEDTLQRSSLGTSRSNEDLPTPTHKKVASDVLLKAKLV